MPRGSDGNDVSQGSEDALGFPEVHGAWLQLRKKTQVSGTPHAVHLLLGNGKRGFLNLLDTHFNFLSGDEIKRNLVLLMTCEAVWNDSLGRTYLQITDTHSASFASSQSLSCIEREQRSVFLSCTTQQGISSKYRDFPPFFLLIHFISPSIKTRGAQR